MKIRLVRSKGRSSITIKAENDRERFDLRDLVMSTEDDKGVAIEKWAKKLKRRGYRGGLTKNTSNVKEFTIKKGGVA